MGGGCFKKGGAVFRRRAETSKETVSTITKSSSREIDEKSLDIFFENLTFQEIFKSRTSMTSCIFAREITETSKFDINVQKF